MVDLSVSGARLAGLGDRAIGERAVLRLDLRDHCGRIVWCRDGVCGVRFDQNLGQSDVDRLRARHIDGPGRSRGMQGAGFHGYREMT